MLDPRFGLDQGFEVYSSPERSAEPGGHWRPGPRTVALALEWLREHDPARPFASVHGAGVRAIYDLADLDRSRFMIATGQSGNPRSAHYRDFIERWRDLEYVRLAGRRQDIRDGALGVLELVPR